MPTTGNGELHQGEFRYACASLADPSCGATALPGAIAVGADFVLEYTPSASGEVKLEPNESFFAVEPAGHFRTMRAGHGAVLVTNPDGHVIDFVNLRIRGIATMAILGVDASTSLAAGETRSLRVRAFDASGEPLAGTLRLEWESGDREVASLEVTDSDRALGTATLKALASGSARLRVVAGAATGSVTVRVGGS